MAANIKVVKVKIAVTVDAHGDWGSCGSSHYRDDAGRAEALDLSSEGTDRCTQRATYWIEVEVPLPTVTTLSGGVVKAAP